MPNVIDLRDRKPIAKKEEPETKQKIEWVALEFVKYKKNKAWFVALITIALLVLIAAILLKNLLLAIATFFATFAVYIYANKEPREINFSISGKGVQVDQAIYKYDDLKSFWIFYDPPEIKELSIRSKKKLMPYIKIPLGNQNPAEIRKLLLKFLPERRHIESTIDTWARKIGF